ncbi:MAG: sel1 repeat family protein [Holosporales bacterium]|jgi:TPR repeat protein|nr:sel1 repeat family protein [Holosporales bacterium]
MFKVLIVTILFICETFAQNSFISYYVFKWGAERPDIVERYLKKGATGKDKNPTSCYILGSLYLYGVFLKKDLKEANRYITMAADLKLPAAINSIGDGYYSGDIRVKDVDMALKFYKKAAKTGFGPAQFNAGVVLLRNYKNKDDLKKSILYLGKASKNYGDLGEIAKAAEQYKLEAEIKLKRLIEMKKKTSAKQTS